MFLSAHVIVKVMLPKKCELSYSDPSGSEGRGVRLVTLN